MLLDGGYKRQLDNVLMGFRRADKLVNADYGVEKTQHVLVAATLPDVGLKSVDAYIARRFPHAERHYKLLKPIRSAGINQPGDFFTVDTVDTVHTSRAKV